MQKAVISLIAHDRPGLVDEVSKVIFEKNTNIVDSRMTALSGEFALIMLVNGLPVNLSELDHQLKEFCRVQKIAYLYRDAQATSGDAAPLTYQVSISSVDHPGIVHQVANFFSTREMNISDLTTQTSPAPHTGTAMFNIHLEVELKNRNQETALAAEFQEFLDVQDLDGTLKSGS